MPSMTTVHIELRARLLMTLKKAGVDNVRKDLVAKYSWMSRWLHVPAHYFVFTDESGIWARDLLRKRRRSFRNTRTTRYVPKSSGDRYSIIPAISYGGLLGLTVLEGTVTRKRFERYLKHVLLPRMGCYPGPNSILVMDNASIHRGGKIEVMCQQKGVLLLYMPPYCPELNPIELAFGILKSELRRTQVLVTQHLNPIHHIKKLAMKVLTHRLSCKIYAECGYNTNYSPE